MKLQQLQLPNPFCWICHLSVLCRLIVCHHTVEADSLTDYIICVLCVVTLWKQNLSLTTQSVSCTSSHRGSRISHWLQNLCPVRRHTLETESFTDFTVGGLKFTVHSRFSNFVFKIRLIRLGFPFQKTNNPVLEHQPTDSQSGVLTTTPQSQLWVGDTEKLQGWSPDQGLQILYLHLQRKSLKMSSHRLMVHSHLRFSQLLREPYLLCAHLLCVVLSLFKQKSYQNHARMGTQPILEL